ncbi:MAG: hypothetical protein ABIA77_02755 [Candidatus Omnitrophota bacterium]
MKKTDLSDMFKKYQPVVKKTGEQLSKAVKTAEEDISKVYKIAQAHIEIQMKNLQKERLYHELGKYVAGQLAKGSVDAGDLEKFKKRLEKIDSEGNKMKRRLTSIARIGKRTKSSSGAKKS